MSNKVTNSINKKRILLVSHEMTYTGAPNSLLKIAKILKEEQFDVSVWSLKDGDFVSEFHKNELDVKNIDFPKDASELMVEELRKFDIVIANTIFCAEFACYSQKYVTTVLYIREAQNIPQLIIDCGLNENNLNEVHHMLCVSEYAKEFIKKNYHPQNLTVIPNFVDDIYEKSKKKKVDRIKFLVAGTVEERKGQHIAVEAFDLLPESMKKEAQLNIVGRVPVWSEKYWNEKIEPKLSKNIFYVGEVKNMKKMQEIYQETDVVLVPSTDESCSLVALEAAMQEKVLIVTENVGAKYLLDDEFIIKINDSTDLCKKMMKCIVKKSELDLIGEENRKRYLKSATKKQYKEKFLKYISELNRKSDMKDEIAVSVVVPTYNVERYLIKCLESLKCQTLKNIEFICVNDGSTDGSLKILESYQKKDKRFKVISTSNYGYGHAVNTGIKAARGKYIGILEPDDYVSDNMYEVLYHRAIAIDGDIVKADFYRFYGEGDNQENIYHSTALLPKNYNRTICPKEEKECFRFIMNTWSGIYRRKFIEEFGIYHNETPGASYQDNGFWFQGFCFAKRIHFINTPLYYNRRDNPGSSVKDRKKVYVANEEYAWIRKFLKRNSVLENEFLYQFSMKKWHTYKFTLNRIAWEYKREYLKYLSDEFAEAEEKGELSKAVFTSKEWEEIHWIIRDYNEYFEKVVKDSVKVSVVIPVYNAEQYLIQCLESLEKQYLKDIEVICVDDGSTDNSIDILEKFSNRDDRFRIIRQENCGAAVARNQGLKMARGEYIIFLDADDNFEPEMLLLAWKKIRETDSDVCVVNSWQHDMATDSITPCDYAMQNEHYPRWRPFRISDMNYNPFRAFVGWAWDKLYRKSFLLNHQLQFQNLRTSNDMYFTYMSLFKAEKITTLDERLIYKRRHKKELLVKMNRKPMECFEMAMYEIERELKEMGDYKKYKKQLQEYIINICLLYLREKEDAIYQQEINECFIKFGISDEQFIKEKKYEDCVSQQPNKMEIKRKIGLEKSKMKISVGNKKLPVKTLNDFSNETEYYKYCLDSIRSSKSYKIGFALTWLPRKIRGW